MSFENCQICNLASYKYTCPRCNIVYCSLSCYKSQSHLKCSEEFYKQCVQEELKTSKDCSSDKDDMRKIYEILKRIRENDEGLEGADLNFDGLDSDDNEEGENEDSQEIEEDNFDEDIAERLKDIDINDADEVWQRLTASEKEEFKNLVSSGDIMKLIPDFKPWWEKEKNSKIVVLASEDQNPSDVTPKVFENIAKYSSLCSKEPSPSVHYNLWNILAAYSCTVRYFNGEHLTNPNEATAFLINLSSSLKYGTNFEDAVDAVVSVEMEALTTGNGATQLLSKPSQTNSLLVADRSRLNSDTRQLMITLNNKLSALSDILNLFQLSKKTFKSATAGHLEFQKLFALSSGIEELTCSKMKKLIKKLEFYLSYVNRESC